jgi:anti-anti-sigma factor
MQVTQTINAGNATLLLSGRFDFNSHRDFRDAYEAVLKTDGITALDVDLAKVEYLDSSALGMLLLLKERSTERNIQVSLVGCSGTVQQILEIANFNKLFTMHQ